MTRTEQAYQYIYDHTMSAALDCDALNEKTKNVIKDTDKWLKRFTRVGDLWIYINRFNSPSDAGPVYEDLKANGIPTFEDIREGFDKQFGRWKDDRTTYNDFIVGQEYTSFDILIFVQHYNTQAGGMFVVGDADQHEAVVIKATLSGGMYANEWLEGKERLKYYFKSRKNVFKESYKENKAILEHLESPIYTFVRDKEEGPFTFEGVFYYSNHHTEQDESKWFELARDFRAADEPIVLKSTLDEELENKVTQSKYSDSASRKARLKKAGKKPKQVTTQSTAYIRNPDVIADVLERANGHCEECQQPAPFNRRADGTPYLEVHHINRLADGGEDAVENAKALCPNCHREAHYG